MVGPAIALAADLAAFLGPPGNIGLLLALGLVNLWALRLGGHIFRRHAKLGEDYRYARMRAKFGAQWWWWSLFQVFLLQGILIWLVALPFITRPAPARFGIPEMAGLLLAAAGLLLEGVADAQLTRFRADPANKHRVLDWGVWAWSRHPNYFGDTLMWWGYFLTVLGSGGSWWLIESPLIMTVLLLKVSGVSLLEDTIVERRPDYMDYIRRTSTFIP
jgi:steroid 5-alpha reductase family enzyme